MCCAQVLLFKCNPWFHDFVFILEEKRKSLSFILDSMGFLSKKGGKKKEIKERNHLQPLGSSLVGFLPFSLDSKFVKESRFEKGVIRVERIFNFLWVVRRNLFLSI